MKLSGSPSDEVPMSPSAAPLITAAQIEAYLSSAASTYKSMRTHPRYNYRWRSLVAIGVGYVLNFVSFIIALNAGWERAPRWVTFWAGIVVSFFILFFAFWCFGITFILSIIQSFTHL